MKEMLLSYVGLCTFNREVSCIEHNKCARCGWNPEVDEARKKETRKRIYVEMLRQQEEKEWTSV